MSESAVAIILTDETVTKLTSRELAARHKDAASDDIFKALDALTKEARATRRGRYEDHFLWPYRHFLVRYADRLPQRGRAMAIIEALREKGIDISGLEPYTFGRWLKGVTDLVEDELEKMKQDVLAKRQADRQADQVKSSSPRTAETSIPTGKPAEPLPSLDQPAPVKSRAERAETYYLTLTEDQKHSVDCCPTPEERIEKILFYYRDRMDREKNSKWKDKFKTGIPGT